jgi:hypothetical protein
MEDLKKRQALEEKTGFNVTKALEMVQAEKLEDEATKTETTTTTATKRRTTTNYKVVKKEDTAATE